MRRWNNNKGYGSYYNVSNDYNRQPLYNNDNSNDPPIILKCTDLPQYDACMAQAEMFQNDDKLHLRNLCNDTARCASLLAIHTPSIKFLNQRRSIPPTTSYSSGGGGAPNSSSSSSSGGGGIRRLVHDHRILLDYSRQRVTGETMEQLFDLADAVGLKDRTEAMYCGKRINTTDDKCVLHHVLRMPAYYDYDVTTEVPTHNSSSSASSIYGSMNHGNNSSIGNISLGGNNIVGSDGRTASSSSARAVSDASASSNTGSSSSTSGNVIINGGGGNVHGTSKDDVLNSSGTDGHLFGSTIIEEVIAQEEQQNLTASTTSINMNDPTASLIASTDSSSDNPLANSTSNTNPLSVSIPTLPERQTLLLPVRQTLYSPNSQTPTTTTFPRPTPLTNQSGSSPSAAAAAATTTPAKFTEGTPTTATNANNMNSSFNNSNLRQQSRSNDMLSGYTILQQVQKERAKVQEFVYQVRNGEYTSIIDNETTLTNFLVVGTGGCILGTKAVATALAATVDGADAAGNYRQLRFVSNIDPVDIYTQTKDWKASKTLVIVISLKMDPNDPVLLLARTIQTWLINDLQFQISSSSSTISAAAAASNTKDVYSPVISAKDIIGRHMIVITQNPGRCQVTLPHIETIFVVPTWVNPRFSLFSAVGLIPLSLQYSYNITQEVMEGAHDMDEHFFQAPLRDNLPVILGLLGVWNSTFLGCSCRATIPFSQALLHFPQYVQHIDMESNGKRVAIDGTALLHRSGEIAFGDCATSCIHSFFQLLHQGRVVPVDFIGFMESPRPIDLPGEVLSNHDELMSHYFAQADALAYGKTLVDLIQEGTPEPQREHSVFTGNRQSTIVLMTRLDAFSIGQLVALYEHRSAVQGFIWGINSFDSYGYELGWNISRNIKSQLVTSRKTGASVQGFNGSTSTLLEQYLAHTRQQELLRQQQQQQQLQQQQQPK